MGKKYVGYLQTVTSFDDIVNFATLGIDVVMLAGYLGAGYYAYRLIASLKDGLLEKGWKQIVLASIFFLMGQFIWVPTDFAGGIYPYYTLQLADGLDMLAAIFLLLGLKYHFEVWRLDKGIGKKTSSENNQDKAVKAGESIRLGGSK
ncbi:MAG: hypothetical protein OK457_06915 [Thaumarchaeota archaeon]|nr:hypothetical protein [Nitrososphaerota archaeon]